MLPEEAGERGLTLASVAVSVIISAFVAASSAYIAVMLSALPWPIILSVILSFVMLKALKRKPTIHEVNVAQAGGSVGGLIAAGVVFTIPAFYYLHEVYGLDIQPPSYLQLLLTVTLASLLGVFLSLPVRRVTIDEEDLPFPSGYAGAEVLKIAFEGGLKSKIVLVAGAIAGLYAAVSPILFPPGGLQWKLTMVGIIIIIAIFPLLVAFGTGYIIGFSPSVSWFFGAVFGWVIMAGILQLIGYQDFLGPVRNMGMGMVFGSGLAFLLLKAIPKSGKVYRAFIKLSGPTYVKAPLMLSLASFIALVVVGIHPLASALAVIGAWVMSAIAGKMTGETNIDPLEQFGLMVGLLALYGLGALGITLSVGQAIYVTCFVATAAALAGDIGHDFKSAKVIGTRPKDIAYVDAIASIVGTVVAVVSFTIVIKAYYSQIFAPESILAFQSKLVAQALYGFPYPEYFLLGLLVGFLLDGASIILSDKAGKEIPLKAMPFGIGMFLGFGLAIPIVVGGTLRKLASGHGKEAEDLGILIAAGLMGGEGFVGFTLGLLTVVGVSVTIASALLAAGCLMILALYTVAKSHKLKR